MKRTVRWSLNTRRWLLPVAAGLLAACGTEGPADDADTGVVEGQSEFVSAGAVAGEQSNDRDANMDAGAPSDGESGGDRTVVEGDIYRVLDGGRILNLNSYRGLQVIDINDLSSPAIIGRFPINGTPVEMYVVDETAYLLINDWRGYWGSRTDIEVGTVTGGLVVAVDISDPTDPTESARAFFPGYLMTSRVASDDRGVSLYAVGNWYGEWVTPDGTATWESHTAVKSFDLTGGGLVERSVLDLGGYVSAVQGVANALLVARNDWSGGSNRSFVSVLDISDSTGVVVEGGEVQVAGYVQNKYNMDLYNDVLRVVSTDAWGGSNTNHVQTFDAQDISALTAIDDETFGDGQSLFATLFLGNKAFFVTYLRMDPFHAFEITDEGDAIERSEFVVSGWNDFLRPIEDGDRLLGIGTNDESGRTMAVSLYDITDLDNANPLLDREEVAADNSWSEASWDDRAFSVLEDAVHVAGPSGEDETGLVLLPYAAWDSVDGGYTAAVQIYTFSRDSLTRRGIMDHGTPVRRSVLAEENTAANISESELSLFDTSNPDAPAELGRVDLAPNYSQVLDFGVYVARFRNAADDWYGWWSSSSLIPSSFVEIVPAGDGIDGATPLAMFEVPGQSQIYAAGDTLVAVQSLWNSAGAYDTTIQTFDLSDPTAPVAGTPIETTEIQPFYSGYYYGWGWGMAEDCFDCGRGWWGGTPRQLETFPGGAVFVQSVQHNERIGTVEYCYANPIAGPDDCWQSGREETSDCSYYAGGRGCSRLNGGEEICTGEFYRCTYNASGAYGGCTVIDVAESDLSEHCYTSDAYRYWNQFELVPLDLSDPTSPRLLPTIEMPIEEESQSVQADGATVYVSYKVPTEVEGDARPYVRWFARPIDFSDPSAPRQGTPINIPGEVIEAEGDSLYTRDVVWGDAVAETMVARLVVRDGRAYLQSSHVFEGQDVHEMQLDGAGSLLVSHRDRWTMTSSAVQNQKLSVFDDESLALLSETVIDAWGEFRGTASERALFSVSGGLLVMNVSDPTAPYAQAYFPTLWWPSEILVSGDDAIFAAGRYGIFQFDLNTWNLLPPM